MTAFHARMRGRLAGSERNEEREGGREMGGREREKRWREAERDGREGGGHRQMGEGGCCWLGEKLVSLQPCEEGQGILSRCQTTILIRESFS